MNGMLRGRILLGALLITVITGAFGGEKPAGTLEAGGRACIRPTLIRLAPGDTQAFRVVMAPRRLRSAVLAEKVRWAVDDVRGGNARLGTIDSEGVYRAPASAPSPCEVHVCAEVEDAANPFLWATVIIGADGPSYERVASWGEPAEDGPRLKYPYGIALEKGGNLIIADTECSKVFRYAPDGEFLGLIGTGGGNKPGCFDAPRDVLVGPKGRIYVSDCRTGPPRLQVFNRKGEYVFGFGQKGVGPGLVLRTRGMALDPAGRFLIADVDNMRVNIYSDSGEFLESWEKDGERAGELNAPYGLVTDRNGDVFVSGYYGPCQKFTRKGEFLFAFAHPDPPLGPVYYPSATGDRWGNVYLAVRDEQGRERNSEDPSGKTVRMMKYNNHGDLVTSFELSTDERGENAAVVDASGNIYALFKRGDQVGVEIFAPR